MTRVAIISVVKVCLNKTNLRPNVFLTAPSFKSLLFKSKQPINRNRNQRTMKKGTHVHTITVFGLCICIYRFMFHVVDVWRWPTYEQMSCLLVILCYTLIMSTCTLNCRSISFERVWATMFNDPISLLLPVLRCVQKCFIGYAEYIVQHVLAKT